MPAASAESARSGFPLGFSAESDEALQALDVAGVTALMRRARGRRR